ncbi:MAG: ECF transporter S component, partial [Anaerotignum sp.]|nr:ECF transporter S component [Anaerotignum sp.]
MGMFVEKWMPKVKWNWLIGAAVGGAVQIFLYFLADTVMFGMAMGIVDIPGNTVQTVAGIILTGVLVGMFRKSGILDRLKEI